jgi:hypothetical protein
MPAAGSGDGFATVASMPTATLSVTLSVLMDEDHLKAERERLKRSFRQTLDLMERMGVPRQVLIEIIREVLAEEERELAARRH